MKKINLRLGKFNERRLFYLLAKPLISMGSDERKKRSIGVHEFDAVLTVKNKAAEAALLITYLLPTVLLVDRA